MSHHRLAILTVPLPTRRRSGPAPSPAPGRTGRRLLALLWPEHPSTLREVPFRLFPAGVQILRLTIAAVLSYLLTLVFTQGPIDLTGSLTALLVLQASTFTTLKMGTVRIGAVLTGVGIAMTVTTWVGLTWWSLALAISAALVLAKLFRLGDQALETPISAMLILATAGQEIAIENRVLTTLIGAGVGIAFAVLLPSAIPVRRAAHQVRQVAADQAALLRRVGEALADHPPVRTEGSDWLGQALHADAAMARASAQVAAVGESRRCNPRAIGTADVEPVLRSGLDLLQRSQVALRTLLWMIERESPHPASRNQPGNQTHTAVAVVVQGLADCLAGFGDLVHAEALGQADQIETSMAATIEVSRETRAMLTELMLLDPRSESDAWLVRESILTSVEAVLELLDPLARAAEHAQWQASQAGRKFGGGPLLNRDTLAALRSGRVTPRVRRVPVPDPDSSPASWGAVRARSADT